MADDADEAIFREWAGAPAVTGVWAEPVVGRLVVEVLAIDQGDQNIDVQQDAQGSSSRRAFTISRVTGPPSERRGSKGTPLRVAAC